MLRIVVKSPLLGGWAHQVISGPRTWSQEVFQKAKETRTSDWRLIESRLISCSLQLFVGTIIMFTRYLENNCGGPLQVLLLPAPDRMGHRPDRGPMLSSHAVLKRLRHTPYHNNSVTSGDGSSNPRLCISLKPRRVGRPQVYDQKDHLNRCFESTSHVLYTCSSSYLNTSVSTRCRS